MKKISKSKLAGLTKVQHRVLKMFLHGKSNQEIASVIGTSAENVRKHHMHGIYKMLGVKTRRYQDKGRELMARMSVGWIQF